MSTGHPAYSLFIPQHGEIVGGPMHGWAYAFIRMHCWPSGQVDPVVRAGMPGWPFPTEVVLTYGSYGRLSSIKGIRTPRVATRPAEALAIAARDAKQKTKK